MTDSRPVKKLPVHRTGKRKGSGVPAGFVLEVGASAFDSFLAWAGDREADKMTAMYRALPLSERGQIDSAIHLAHDRANGKGDFSYTDQFIYRLLQVVAMFARDYEDNVPRLETMRDLELTQNEYEGLLEGWFTLKATLENVLSEDLITSIGHGPIGGPFESPDDTYHPVERETDPNKQEDKASMERFSEFVSYVQSGESEDAICQLLELTATDFRMYQNAWNLIRSYEAEH